MANRSTRTLTRVGITTLALTLAACGGGGGSSDGTEAPAPVTAALSQAADCTDLLEAVRGDARDKIRVQADELRARGWQYTGGGLPSPQATAAPGAMPTPATAPSPPRDATDTNTQVPGVDEADVVETDGTRLYLLHRRELLVLPATPPEALALGDRIPIEGGTHGMFVADGRGLVVSSVTDDGALGGDPRCDAIGLPFPTDFAPPCGAFFTKMTLVDFAETPARIAREVYVEGSYVGARRHGSRVRLIVQRSWGAPPGVGDPWATLWSPTPAANEAELTARIDAWETAALAAIDASTAAQWLPTVRERIAGDLVERPLDCTDAYVAPPAHAQHGTTLIVGLDLGSDDAPLEATTLIGLASQLYANEDTLVLAYPEWQAVPLGESMTRTALHVFALGTEGLSATYRGSGFVPGDVLSQFAIDVRDDVVRVATSYGRALDGQSVTRVHTARIENDALAIVGATGDIAPGERLQSARFLGDRAYLVTFLQIDPLFVIDLADPARPTVLGEVEIPGFSQYLHPLDATHLLTIGQGETGPAIKMFDVGDATAPRLLHDYPLPNGAWSPAQWNHLAFTYDARLGLLALPVNVSLAPSPIPTLQLLAIEPATGIQLQSEIRHDTPPVIEPCAPPYDWEGCDSTDSMERGLFIDDAVYSISMREIRVHLVTNPGTSLATVRLP